MVKYYAIEANANGEAIITPLLSWFRQNKQNFPEGKQSDNTHALFRKLIKKGWKDKIGNETAYIISPDNNRGFDYAQNCIKELDIEADKNEDTYEEAQEMTFGLESQMQAALRINIQQLESGLEIIDGGTERHTSAGFIDITAKDSKGNIVIIELKAPIAKPEVIAQTLAYMQAIQDEYKGEVRGIIVASDFVDRVKMAARQIPNLNLVQYTFQFNFNSME
jgi:hypothetical protein